MLSTFVWLFFFPFSFFSFLPLCTNLSEGNGNPLQYSCLENPMDRGAWHVMVHRVIVSWTGLK